MELWEGEGEPGCRGEHALGRTAAGGEKGTLFPLQGMLGHLQVRPPALGCALHSCPVGMGDSSGMSTVQPGRVCLRSSCSWEVTGTYSSTGMQ